MRREWTPAGAAFTEGPAVGFDREFGYDRAGRLVAVRDRTAAGGGGLGAADPAAAGCVVRAYRFDANGNRTGLTRRDAEPDGSCAAAGGTTVGWGFDSAHRLVSGVDGVGSYGYDPLGRVTTLPGVDSPAGAAAGELAIGYFDTDAVRSITQAGSTTTYTLDVVGRRRAAESGPAGGPVAARLVRHYGDGSDNPAWVEQIVAGRSTLTHYVEALGGELRWRSAATARFACRWPTCTVTWSPPSPCPRPGRRAASTVGSTTTSTALPATRPRSPPTGPRPRWAGRSATAG